MLLLLPLLAEEVAAVVVAEGVEVDNDEDDGVDTVIGTVECELVEDCEDDVCEFDEELEEEEVEDVIVAVGFDVERAVDEVELEVGGGIVK